MMTARLNAPYIPGILKSIVSKSTENREEIRPDGVVEKKESGAPKEIMSVVLKTKKNK